MPSQSPSSSPSSSSSLHGFVSASLSQGRAVTLKPRAAGVLRVTRGRAWATLDVSRHSPLSETGDHFVTLGNDLPLRAGQRVVVEAWAYPGEDGIALQWEPMPSHGVAQRWQAEVVKPLRDTGRGLALAARAMGRVAAGVAAVAIALGAAAAGAVVGWAT